MENNKIEEISLDVKTFLGRSSRSLEKINKLEDKVSKMQNYFSRPIDMDSPINLEEKAAFNDFIRNGIQSELVTKAFSGKDDEAGMTLAPTLSKQIITRINAKSPMRQLASIESISTRSLDIIIENGEFVSGWVSEVDQRDATNTPRLNKKTIFAHEIYAQPKATQSIIDDSEMNLENWLIERIAESFVRLENQAFIVGDGANKPFGILGNSDIKKLDVGNSVSPEIILHLISELEEGYLSNASFLMNRKTLSSIQGLKDNTGRFIWQQSLSDPLKQTIFGVPVVISSHMPDIEDNALAIAIGDFNSGYKIVDRANITLVRDPYTEKPYVKFYAVKRVGGDVINPEAIKFAKFSS